ncbi:MAG: hypothetical protein ACSLFM_02685 [Tepidiformaceae bacterium]
MAGAGAVDGVPSGHAITVYPWLQIALEDLPARADHPDVVFWGDVYDVSWTVGFHEKARDMRSPAITGNCATIVVENRTALDERDGCPIPRPRALTGESPSASLGITRLPTGAPAQLQPYPEAQSLPIVRTGDPCDPSFETFLPLMTLRRLRITT